MSSLPTNGQYTVGTDPVDLIDLAAVLQAHYKLFTFIFVRHVYLNKLLALLILIT